MGESCIFAVVVIFASWLSGKRAGCWKSWRRCWLWLVPLLLVSGLVRADLKIINVEAPDVELPIGASKVHYVFKVNFKLAGNEEDYNFVIADRAGIHGSGISLGNRAASIQHYIKPSIKYSQPESKPSTGTFTLGDVAKFSSQHHDYPLVAEFAIDIDADNLRSELRKDPKFIFSFYIVGQALDKSLNPVGVSEDKEVLPRVKIPPTIQISKLKDIVISDRNKVGRYYQSEMSFCVSLSNAPFEYTVKVTDSNTGGSGKFKLVSSSNAELRYDLAFENKIASIKSVSYRSRARYLNNNRNYLGSSAPDCGAGNTGAIGIRVLQDKADSVQDGIYTDTVTVTVEPK
ncbi:MAG: hypothetical protein QS748_06120 [Candidatus Endonucleobacter bathymodioli]|uniref:Spore coat protein U domain-containing protein n=1 Tax=Candidatus Endonucleibacter bathymodioli TaxID=539814 RepID=A0AA90SSP9_9GAMM|nr:hypothetical protein [Candidatus Endonucleobacter bathymodioli]